MNWTESDLRQFSEQDILQDQVEQQIQSFKQGFPPAKLNRPAVVGDGILQFTSDQQNKYVSLFETEAPQHVMQKFTPASGAASRMFKHLFAALDGTQSELGNEFFDQLTAFAFYDELKEALSSQGIDISTASHKEILEALLHDPMRYGAKPKALISFHKDGTDTRLALEEHFLEGANYAVGENGVCELHFTVSPEHLDAISKACTELKLKYEKRYAVKYNVTFSTQAQSTNTIAVTPENKPFRQPNGELLFRPGGHGALIENLNALTGDVIFVKNIDNVCVPGEQPETWKWKKVIAGFLLEVKALVKLVIDSNDPAARKELESFGIPAGLSDEELKNYVNRPIRICGMVKNQGEPGGGPFWVTQGDGNTTLQIVEKAQIDATERTQLEILNGATHFNPVDLVCYTKDADGKAFDLLAYTDPNTGFIAEKSVNGQPVKALELPGLWNGAMAQWLTFFVEVPLATFNPVKTVNDLIKPMHQA